MSSYTSTLPYAFTAFARNALPTLYILLSDIVLTADDGEERRVKDFAVNRIWWLVKQGEATFRLR